MARVSDAEIKTELEAILDVLRLAGKGVSRDNIEEALREERKRALPARTLQRRLERLLIEGKVQAEGDGRSTTYRLHSGTDPSGEGQLSAQGMRLRHLILRPIGKRTPVGYDRDWLFNYKPGKSWYLTKAQRTHLRRVGEVADDDRPAGTFARDILNRLLIDLAWASSRLEGNTYSRLDTQNLLEFGQRAEGKDASEAQMILNHKAAIEYIVDVAEEQEIRGTTIFSVHAALSENLLDEARDEGRLREISVNISGSSYTPTAIPQVIREAFERIVWAMNHIPDPFEKSFFALVHIPYQQPFVDVNKRTSRLLSNLPLLSNNLCPLSFVGADEQGYLLGTLAVYEERRVELLRDFYISAYGRSAAQYRVVRGSVVVPDPIRLRYRNELGEAVREIVRSGEAPTTIRIRELAERVGIVADDRSRFVDVTLELLLNLNEGSAARYRLRPSEFVNWEGRVRNVR